MKQLENYVTKLRIPTYRKSFLPPSSESKRSYTAAAIQQSTWPNIPVHSNLPQHRCQKINYVVRLAHLHLLALLLPPSSTHFTFQK